MEHVGSRVSPNWYNLGLRLGLHDYTLDGINLDAKECKIACRIMFQEWLRSNHKGTWNNVIVALRSYSVGENSVADNLEEMMA